MAKEVNHVVVNGKTIVDLREDSVTPENLGEGVTAHNAAGEQIVGTGKPVFYVTVSGAGDDLTADKTLAEITTAYNAGNTVVARQSTAFYALTYISDAGAEFTRSDASFCTVLSCSNPGGPSGSDIWQSAVTFRLNRDTKYRDIGLKTVLGAISELQDGSGVTSDAITAALGYTPRKAWYVTVTQTSADSSAATADKTDEEMWLAYQSGYSLYARVYFVGGTTPIILPLVAAENYAGLGLVLFFEAPTQGEENGPLEITGAGCSFGTWVAWTTQGAKKTDIPTTLPNPNALTLKVGDTTTTYDGSTMKTVEITGDGAPSYVLTAADSLATKVAGHIGADNIVFAVMADAHLNVYTDTTNAAGKQAGQALARLNERCPLDFVAHVGDYTTGAYNTTVTSAIKDNADYNQLIGSQFSGKQIWCVGNHDDAPYQATANRMTQTQVYAAIARKNLISGGYVPDNACYGYMDFPEMRLRVIYLDTHDRRDWASSQVGAGAECDFLNVENISGEQLQYLVNHALDFSGVDDSSKWSILVFSHAVLGTSGNYTDPSGTVHPCNTSNAATILNAYGKKKSGSITHNGITVNYNFSEVNPAGVIACIHGHEHRYANELVGGSILSICCPNITNGRERVSADGNTYSKTAGTANGTSFCTFSINRADKKIYVDHYGPGVDREFTYKLPDPSIAYTNVLPAATDTDGSIYNEVGWKAGYRLTSSGALEALNASYVTGFIPVKKNDVIRFKDVIWRFGQTTPEPNSGNQRMAFYDINKNFITLITAAGVAGQAYGVKGDDNIWTKMQIPSTTINNISTDNIAYFRLNCAGISGDSVITINEEIT